jgi:integrase
MEEGCRRDNPARQTRRPKAKPPKVYRLTRSEAAAFLAAAETVRERRIAQIGICAGAQLRARGLQGRHFQRAAWVWISADIAKGGRRRWIPVLPELEPVAREIRETVAPDGYVIPAQRWRDPGDAPRQPARGADRNRTGGLVESRPRAESVGVGRTPGGECRTVASASIRRG